MIQHTSVNPMIPSTTFLISNNTLQLSPLFFLHFPPTLQVKTTQPRRYLVRPNQGIVAPGCSETVSILLVDKDRQVLWSTFERLGQSALDHSKDKFLVQSCEVDEKFSSQFRNEQRGEGGQYKKDLAEALTSMWNSVTSVTNVQLFNKKLHVRHVVEPTDAQGVVTGGGASSTGGGVTVGSSPSQPSTLQAGGNKTSNTENMSPEQLFDEVASLRRKYDELVAFSVNLTAERDILNNTLEQTKRDLNREMATRTALEKQGLRGGSRSFDAKSSKSGSNGTMSTKNLLIVVVLTFLLAVRATNSGSVNMLKNIPLVGGLLGFKCCSKHNKKHGIKEAVNSDEL